MRSHISPSAPGRIPWLGADLVEGPDLSDRHGLFLDVSGDMRFARRPKFLIGPGDSPCGEPAAGTAKRSDQ
jgi:hypothetical protein